LDLATSVRGKRISAAELVGSSIDRIERVNPSLNAVVALRAEEALEEAANVDRRVSAGDTLGPLAGIPFLVKDTENTAGMQTTYGSLLFADTQPALRDDLGARRLKAAGAIVLGKTNTPEFAFEGYTDNRLFGPTRNPWGTDWSPGGSSGGSAAALAAGMSPVATASDGGGSIRIPAALCGLVGLKPTMGAIGRDPIPPWMDLSSDGPLGCSVEDVRLLLSVVSGPVAGDLMALPIRPFLADRLPTRALALRRFVGYGPLPEAVDLMFGQALRSLADLGISVDIIDPPFSPGESNVDRDWRRLSSVEQLTWLGRERVQANLDRFHPGFRATMEDALTVSLDEYLAARRRRFQYVRVLDELLADDTVIISPTLCEEGWFADGVTPRIGRVSASDGFNVLVHNLTGVPAISLPAGLSANGIPFGLQITGPRRRDDLLLQIAEAWQAAKPWPLTAPGYEQFSG
jgi:Asp-tRNA(Asn)/Glu-tRNA(Gln) amidotransferase A subunit family amidase